MTKSPRKNVLDVGIELRAACMLGELASDRATMPGLFQNLIFHLNRDSLKLNAYTITNSIYTDYNS